MEDWAPNLGHCRSDCRKADPIPVGGVWVSGELKRFYGLWVAKVILGDKTVTVLGIRRYGKLSPIGEG